MSPHLLQVAFAGGVVDTNCPHSHSVLCSASLEVEADTGWGALYPVNSPSAPFWLSEGDGIQELDPASLSDAVAGYSVLQHSLGWLDLLLCISYLVSA